MTDKITPMDIYRHLPKTNCKKCGYSTCMAFAVEIVNQKAFIDECPTLNEAKYIRQKLAIKENIKKLMSAAPTNLVVHDEKCSGCGTCVVACPVNVSLSLETSGGKGPTKAETIMIVDDGILKIKNIKLCRRFEEEGSSSRPCSVCVDSCSNKAIEFM